MTDIRYLLSRSQADNPEHTEMLDLHLQPGTRAELQRISEHMANAPYGTQCPPELSDPLTRSFDLPGWSVFIVTVALSPETQRYIKPTLTSLDAFINALHIVLKDDSVFYLPIGHAFLTEKGDIVPLYEKPDTTNMQLSIPLFVSPAARKRLDEHWVAIKPVALQ